MNRKALEGLKQYYCVNDLTVSIIIKINSIIIIRVFSLYR